jgi:hypothetical protein
MSTETIRSRPQGSAPKNSAPGISAVGKKGAPSILDRNQTVPLGPLPIVIGVTGHRDLRPQDVPRLEEIVRGIFRDLQSRYPSTPIVALSPLAEGADRLCARVALGCGARLVVTLPFSRSLYELDFTSAESRQEFEELHEHATDVIDIPLPTGVTDDDLRRSGPARDYQYGAVGAYVVLNSQTLIALWDGNPPQLINGTGDVVAFNLNGIPEAYDPNRNPLDVVSCDPVYHIVTPRLSTEAPIGEPLSLRMLFPSESGDDHQAEKDLYYVYERTEVFNRDSVRLAGKLKEARQRSRSYVIDTAEIADSPLLGQALELFATADTMAEYFSRRTRISLNVLFGAVTVAAVVFDLYMHLFAHAWIMLLIYLVLLTATYGLVLHSRRKEYHSRYLDYRAIAEGLRVQLFWKLAGIGKSAADFYLHKQRSELDWVRYAIRQWHLGIPRAGRSEQPSYADGLRLVQKHWIDDQFSYFQRASKREERRLKGAERFAGLLVVIGIALALVQVGLLGLVDDEPAHALLVTIALAPILAGLVLGYVEKRAFGNHAKQYERMSVLFSNARRQLARLLDAGEVVRAQLIVEELGKEALMENGDWVLLHRDRPIEVPKG